jgi:hypothetical protein
MARLITFALSLELMLVFSFAIGAAWVMLALCEWGA